MLGHIDISWNANILFAFSVLEEKDRQKDRETDRQTVRQTDRQTDR